jgi:DHA2 family methylenomycin A resistance protein-like MFS transporter
MQKSKISDSLALFAISIGYIMVIMDVTIVNVVLPVIGKNLNGGIAKLQWVVDGYALTFACFLLSAGSVADRLGAKRGFIAGLALFLITSLFCGLSNNFLSLNISRLFQGLAAALIMPTSLSLINSLYDNHKTRSKAIAVWAGLSGVAAALAPILGAILTIYFGWRGIFFVNIFLAFIGIILTIIYVPNKQVRTKTGHIDIWGQISSILMVSCLAFTLIEAGKIGWFSPLIIEGIIFFIIFIMIFLMIEFKSSSPMLPLHLFKISDFSAAVVIGMLINIGFYGELFILPLYFQLVKGYSVLMTSLAITPIVIFISLFCYLGGKMTSVRGSKEPLLLGLAIAVIAFLSVMLVMKMNYDHYFLLILPLVAMGFGLSFVVAPATIAVISSVPQNKSGIASATFNASRQIGSLIGVAVFGSIINSNVDFKSGNNIALAIGAFVFMLAWILALLFIKKKS